VISSYDVKDFHKSFKYNFQSAPNNLGFEPKIKFLINVMNHWDESIDWGCID